MRNILIFIFIILLCSNINVGVSLNNTTTLNISNSTIGNFSNISKLSTNFSDLNNITKNLKEIDTKINNTINISKNITKNENKKYIHYLIVLVKGYKVIVKTNGMPYGFANNISLKFVKINNGTYVISPIILNVPIKIYAKFSNETLNKTIILNYTKIVNHYLNVSFNNFKLIVKTNGKLFAKYKDLDVNVEFKKINEDAYIIYPLLLNTTLIVYSKFDNETLNKTIFLNYSENYSLNNLNISIILKKVYFPSEKIIIKTNFKPNKAYIITPNNKTINLKIHKKGKYYYLSAKLNKNVILGNYSVLINGIKKTFIVDYYKINAKFNNSCIFGNISYHYVMPKIVEYKIMPFNISKNVMVENGSFCIPINLTEGNYTVILKCGNAITKIMIKIKNLSLKVPKFAFVGNKIRIFANFKPKNAKLITPYKNLTLNFSKFNKEEYVSTFKANKTGVYKIIVDNITKEVYVDNYSINVSLNGSKIVGNICWKYIPPKYINYTIFPKNITKSLKINNSNFIIKFPKNTEKVIIYCGNVNKTIQIKSIKQLENISDYKTIIIPYENKTYKINISINKGKFKELKFIGGRILLIIDNLSVEDSVNLTVKLPFKIPEGMYIYYWKKINNKTVLINYTIGKDRKTIIFKLKDGGELDEDRRKNGIIIDPFKFYIPKYNVKTEFKNNKTGILYVKDLEGNELYNITVTTNKGKLDYLKFVNKNNIPVEININLPLNLIKFKISNISKGEKVNVSIVYQYSNISSITNSNIRRSNFSYLDNFTINTSLLKLVYYKFNPNNLLWKKYPAIIKIYRNKIVVNLTLEDGKFGDDDNKTNGIIEDDGGVGWVGYYNVWDVAIGSNVHQQVHTYWLYVPKGINNFSFGVYDGDGFIVNIYYPNGTLYTTLNESANNNWNYTLIYTNGSFGFWKIVINNTLSPVSDYNIYGLNISGSNSLDLKVNTTYVINGTTYYGTPNATLLSYGSTVTSSYHDFYVYATSDFNIAIFDPDNLNGSINLFGLITIPVIQNRLKVSVYYPNGTLYYSFYPYDNTLSSLFNENDNPIWVIQNISIHGQTGWWRIELTQEQDYYDDDLGNNQVILATNLSGGLWFKIPIPPSSADSGTATICRNYQTNMVHRYYVIVPYGISNFTVGIYDGDGLIVNVSYPNGTWYGSYIAPNNAQAGEPPNYFLINTSNVYGWWIVDIFENSWPSTNGNYYSLLTINSPVLKLNKTYLINGSTYYGTPDAMIVGDDTTNLGNKTWYISTPKGLSLFNLSVYDGDGAINVSIYLPNGTKYKEFTAYGNESWYSYIVNVTNPNQNYGVWKIFVHEIRNYDDYITGGNVYRIATTTKTGILSGNPRYNLSIVNVSTKTLVNISETFNITVYVKNTGTMDLSNVSVNITLPIGWSGETYKVIPYLLPNQTVAINFTLTAPVIPGNYTLIVNTTNDYVHWDFDDYKNITITVISPIKNMNITSSISMLPQGYFISVKSFINATDVYVFWYKPNNTGVIDISGNFDLNGTYNNVYWFEFNTINANETKNITITTNITTIEGLIIGVDPK
ncbi:NPCBM_assoc domain-containing protein [Methanocaldococcus lauensis]|nr:NPCBM_assoc domain-containing protein [Methanocaldococcus lauensis]